MASAHHRSRSSIDCAIDVLLSELDENQVELLLREAESTVAGNIGVSKGIDFFDQPSLAAPTQLHPRPPSVQLQPAPRRKFINTLSPRKQTELKRRLSKRAAQKQAEENNVGTLLEPTTPFPQGPRGYKRINPPTFSLPPSAAPSDLIELLVACLMDDPSLTDTPDSASLASSALPSPTTPRFPISQLDESEGLDLLEPAPFRSPRSSFLFGNPMNEPTRNMSGIFEVLGDAALFGPRH